MVVLDLFVASVDAPPSADLKDASFSQIPHSVTTAPYLSASLTSRPDRPSSRAIDSSPYRSYDNIAHQRQKPLLADNYDSHLKDSSLPPSITLISVLRWLWHYIVDSYNRITLSLFPNEPEHLDLQLTVFFISQLPCMLFIVFKWVFVLMPWLLGYRSSQKGDHGAGKGMRRSWSINMGMALSFLKTYLRHAENLTIEECQSRSKAIPLTTVLAGIRVHKVKIPSLPYRATAEDMVYDSLTNQERDLLGLRKNGRRAYGINCEKDVINCALEQNHNHRQQPSAANTLENSSADDLRVEWLEYIGPNHPTQDPNEKSNYAVVIYFHGGGYYTGSAEEHRLLVGPLAQRLGKKIRILGVNYRLAPQHPFPAALVDGLTTYMWLLDQSVSESFFPGNHSQAAGQRDRFQPSQIILMGDSAGGGLALSMSILIRDRGTLPQPLSLIGWSPWLDLTQSLPSFKENMYTDCIPYEDFVHPHSPAIDMMFEAQESGKRKGSFVRQRAQVYCPDSCLRNKYVSPLFETDFKGIANVFITCGSAERFSDECILMAARLEAQQQPCRIDIHEDMPHIFQLFRLHPSSIASLDRTCAYIKDMVNRNHAMTGNDDVIISISPSSSSIPSSPHFTASEPITVNISTPVLLGHGYGVRRVDSSSSVCSILSEDSVGSSTSVTSEKKSTAHHRHGKGEKRTGVAGSASPVSKRCERIRVEVGVVDLKGYDSWSYHQQDRTGPLGSSEKTFNRYDHCRRRLLIKDVVSDATLYSWEVLLSQGYIPTRHWPHPPTQ